MVPESGVQVDLWLAPGDHREGVLPHTEGSDEVRLQLGVLTFEDGNLDVSGERATLAEELVVASPFGDQDAILATALVTFEGLHAPLLEYLLIGGVVEVALVARAIFSLVVQNAHTAVAAGLSLFCWAGFRLLAAAADEGHEGDEGGQEPPGLLIVVA